MVKNICLLTILWFGSQIFSSEPASHFFWKEIPIEQVLEDPPESLHSICSFQTSNFPPLSRYKLFSRNLGSPKRILFDCVADGEGRLMCCRGRELFELAGAFQLLNNFMPGEPVEFLLVSEDKKTEMSLKIIPNPIETSDEEGRGVSLEVINQERMIYQFHLTNFKPNELVSISSISGDEELTHQIKVSDKGRLTAGIHPGIVGKKRGSSSLKVTPVESKKTMTLHFEWGV